mmetsp:Transcript_11538/g.24306  ORF Transcript_11538/g.24306 Transcript_11538/m.24306 type:complete len:383 (+) Transcript_11538:207-1355(+)
MAPSKQSKSKAKKATVRDPRAKPKRPLSAYNLFFQYERDLLLQSKPSKKGQSHDEMHRTILNNPSERRNRSKTVRPPPHGKIGFAELARMIGKKWKTLDDTSLEHFQGLAAIEKKRYVKECSEWKARMKREADLEASDAAAQKPPSDAKGKDPSTAQGLFGVDIDEASVMSAASIQGGSVSDFDGLLSLVDNEDITSSVSTSTNFHQDQQQLQHGQGISQRQVYGMLERACEIGEGGIDTPLPVQSGNIPLNSARGFVSSCPYENNISDYCKQQDEQHHADFAPPEAQTSHPHYEIDGQYEQSQSQSAQIPYKVSDTYPRPWGAPPKNSVWAAPRISAPEPPRVVSGGSTHESAGDSLGSGFDSATTFDGDILDLLSRIVAD